MRKLLTLVAATLMAANLFAVPAPTNVHWDGTTLKWELPALTDDSVYTDEFVTLYNAEGEYITSSGGDLGSEYDFSSEIYHGRTYYATVQSRANPGEVYSPEVQSPNYIDPNPKDTLEVPSVTLNASGLVSWCCIGYTYVRATLQKKNAGVWEDVKSDKTTNGWHTSISLGNISVAGTYRAIADGLQGEDVVRRGISEEIEVEVPFTVSFNAQSLFANPDNAPTPRNTKIDLPTIPDDYRYNSDGHLFYWSTDAAGNNPWEFSTDVVTADTTLYAQWKEWPALNPVWDVDTCRWTMFAGAGKILYNLTVNFYTENDVNFVGSGIGLDDNSYFSNEFFPGRKYSFEVMLTDLYSNYISAKSALHTISGEATTLPLTNMAVSDPATARITWDAPLYTVYMKTGRIDRWNKVTEDWSQVTAYEDGSHNWNHYGLAFNVALDNTEYYKIHCTLNQGEYVIYEGEIFYGTEPVVLHVGDEFYATPNFNSNENILHLKITELGSTTGKVEVMAEGHTLPENGNLCISNVNYGDVLFSITSVAQWADFQNVDTIVLSPDVVSFPVEGMSIPNLKTFGLLTGSNYFSVVDGVLYSKDKHTLLKCPARNPFNGTFPSEVDSIAPSAFYTCSEIGEIVLPSGLTTLTNNAFYGSSITKITIPASVIVADYDCLGGCLNLAEINFENVGNLREISWSAFRGSKVIEDQDQDGFHCIGNLVCELQTPDNQWPETLEFPEGIENIITGFYYFSYMTNASYANIKKIVLPSTLKNICRGALAEGQSQKMPNLETIVVKAKNVPTVEFNVEPLMLYTDKYLTLQVPCGTETDYSDATQWRSAVDAVEAAPLRETIDINFLTNPYMVMWPEGGVLPECVELTGNYHNEHGYHNPTLTLPLAAGNYKITVGNCQYSSTGIEVKTADGSTTLDLIDANGQTVTTVWAKDGCFTGSEWTTRMTYAWFVLDADQTVEIVCPEYTPYFTLEPVDDVPVAVTMHKVTFVAEGAEGLVPEAVDVVDGESITIPINYTLYKEGYTLTSWTDGENYYTMSETLTPTADITLTAVWDANAVDLLTATTETEVSWTFGRLYDAPSVEWQDNTPHIWVGQAMIGSDVIDVKMDINTTSAKFSNNGRTDEWCQVNTGTTFTFPSKKGITVSTRCYSEPTGSTLNDVTYTSWISNVATYGTDSEASTALLFNNANTYYSYIHVVYPASSSTAIENTAVEGKAVKRIVNGQLLIERDGKTFNAQGAQVK